MPSLSDHPRLLFGARERARLREPAPTLLLNQIRLEFEAQADAFLDRTTFDQPLYGHNAHLVRARRLQDRVITLLARYGQTGDARYRRAAIDHLRLLGEWDTWSWIAWRANCFEPDAVYDLSYGENAMTLALAADWLYHELSTDEKKWIVELARTRAFAAFLNTNKTVQPDFWFKHAHSNWNTVCSGGAGALALALYEDCPEAEAVLARAEESIIPYFDTLETYAGGWPEGVGYWAYGMMYGFRYLLSWEKAFGRAHPLMERPGVAQTLDFPLDFCPNGHAAGFGDSNQFAVHAFHYALAERLNRLNLVETLDSLLAQGYASKNRPGAAELTMLHPRRHVQSPTRAPHARHYPILDWFMLADRTPQPRLSLTLRGGTTDVPHSHADLMSFNLIAADGPLLENIDVGSYLDSTFSPRRYELFEIGPTSKNSLFINGLGIVKPSQVVSAPLLIDGFNAVRVDATGAFGIARNGPPDRFAGRLAILIGHEAALIIDRIALHFEGLPEMRLHTRLPVACEALSATLERKQGCARVCCAATEPAKLHTAKPLLTMPDDQTSWTTLRLITEKLVPEIVFATLILPEGKGAVAIRNHGENVLVDWLAGERSGQVALSHTLHPL